MSLQEVYEQLGATFLVPETTLQDRLKGIRAFIFDWDGVFNNGIKAHSEGSPFSEADSMGLNMLRFSYWLKHQQLPFTAIVTGENNLTALRFAEREHLNATLLNAKNKRDSISRLTQTHGLKAEEIAFFFDDILDLNAAEWCGLRLCVNRNASPQFRNFVSQRNLAHYISAREGGQHAVREITELLVNLNGNFEETIERRMEHTGVYQTYITERNAITVVSEKG